MARRARAASRPVWATAAAVAAALLLAACASTLAPAGTAGSAPGHNSASRSGAVITLNNISTLRTLFNREAGHPRLILIFSPT